MSACSINTECRCDSLVAAIRDVLDARDEDLDDFAGASLVGDKVFRAQYPRLSDALDHAEELINSVEEIVR